MCRFINLVTVAAVVRHTVCRAAPSVSTGCTLIRPSNTSVCGVRGNLRNNVELYGPYDGVSYSTEEPANVTSVVECADLCARRVFSRRHHQTYPALIDTSYYGLFDTSYCHSFLFDTKTNLCWLGSYDVEDAAVPHSAGPYIFYNSTCYNCGAFCNQPNGQNLLDNGDFENSLFGPWESYGGSITRGHGSKQAWGCLNQNFCALVQQFDICPGSLYAFKYDYDSFTSNPSGFCSVQMDCGQDPASIGDQTSYSSSDTYNASGHWKTARGFFTPTKQGSGPQFNFQLKQNCSYLIDNVYVAHTPVPSVKHSTESLIINGGFETGAIAPFHTVKYTFPEGRFQIVSPGIDSKYALRFDARRQRLSLYLEQNLTTIPNTLYVFTVDCYSTQGTDYVPTIEFITPHEQITHSFQSKRTAFTFSIPIVATAEKTLFRISVFAYGGNLTFDNFSLREAATPFPI